MTQKISFVVTAYEESKKVNQDGSPWIAECIAGAILDDRVSEIVIRDDASFDFLWLRGQIAHLPKVRLITGSENYGTLGNKIMSVKAAQNDWVALIDSDNVISTSYFDRIAQEAWEPDVMLCPDFAAPHFDYRDHGGMLFDLKSLCAEFPRWKLGLCFLNTGNNFFHRRMFLDVIEPFVGLGGVPGPLSHAAQPMYFPHVDLTPIEMRRLYDVGEVHFINKQWLFRGCKLRVVAGLEYGHRWRKDSVYSNAPRYKLALPTIHLLEMQDRAAGIVGSTYCLQALRPNGHFTLLHKFLRGDEEVYERLTYSSPDQLLRIEAGN